MSDFQIPHDEIKHTALVGKDNLGARIFHVETIGGAHYILKVDKFGKGSVIAVAPHRAISKTKAEKIHSIQWDKESELFKSDSDDQTKGIAQLVASIKDKTSEIQQLKELNPQAFEAIIGITNELVHILKTTKDVNIKDVQNDQAFEKEIDSHLKDSDESEDKESDDGISRVAHAEKQHNTQKTFAPGAVRDYEDGTKAQKMPDGSWKTLPKTGIATAKSEDGAPELDKTQPKIRFPEFKSVSTRPDQDVHIVKDKKSVTSFMKKFIGQSAEAKISPAHKRSYQKTTDQAAKKMLSGQTQGQNYRAFGDRKSMSIAAAPELRDVTGSFNSFGKELNHPKALAYKDRVTTHYDTLKNKAQATNEFIRANRASTDPEVAAQSRVLRADFKKEKRKSPRSVKLSMDDYKKEIDKQRKKGAVDPKLIDDVRRMGNAQDRTVEHESLHQMLSTIEQKHSPQFRNQIVSQLLSQHKPEDLQDLAEYVQRKGYKPRTPSFNEEVLAHSRDVLINSDAFKNHLKQHKGHGMSEEEKEAYARKRINSIKKGHQKTVAYAKKLKPENVSKSEDLQKNIIDSTLMHGEQDVNHDLMNWVYGQDELDLDGDLGSWVIKQNLEGSLDSKLVAALNLCVNKHKEDTGFELPIIDQEDSAEVGMYKLLHAKMMHDESMHENKTLIEPDETTLLVVDNQDGTAWYNIGKHLQSEAAAMNHDCDTDCRKDDTVLSLRENVNGYHQPLLTAVSNNGYITSIKDRHGYKPNGNWEQIKNLLLNPAIQGIIEDHNALHPGFKFQDMPMNMQSEILDVKPAIDTITSKERHEGIGESHSDVRDAVEYANVKRSHNPTGWRQDIINDYHAQQAPKMALLTLGQLTSEEYNQLGSN